jgi:hypothetical protein
VSTLGERVRDVLHVVDRHAIDAIVRRVGVGTQTTRDWLRGRGLAFVEEGPRGRPSDGDLARTASVVIARSSASASSVGLLAGLGGLWSIPPDVAGRLVSILRLSQRLAVVYGIDPETPRGHAAVLRALAAAFDVDVPDHGFVDSRASAMVRALVPRGGEPGPLAGRVARAAVGASLQGSVSHVGRLVPLVGSGIAARDDARDVAAIGERMLAVFSRLVEAAIDPNIRDAEEIRGG